MSGFEVDAAGRGRQGSIFSPGDLVRARFRVEELIGRGGMGEVYRVENLSSGDVLALKVVQPDLLGSSRTRTRFEREVDHTRRISHPNVVRIVDFFHEPPPGDLDAEPMPCLVMEYLAGETLADHLARRGPMSSEEATPLLCQMAAALSAAHRVGIVHRDLKPDNVFLVPPSSEESERGPRVVLTDFGVAREERPGSLDESELTATDVLLGTPDYMAPEQLDLEEAIPASDIYALGLVAYQMVTGHLPFEDERPLEALFRRVREKAPPIRLHDPEVDPGFEAAVMNCLARDPRNRTSDAQDFLRELDPSSPLRVRRGPRPEHLAAVGVVLALVVAVAILVWLYAG
ncbi:MAG: serine/threonine-protein kinase [Acidobacteriota bacterium]